LGAPRQPRAVSPPAPPPPNYFRFRLGPDFAIALGTMVMSPGEKMAGTQVELLASHRPTAEEMEAYDRLLSEAMRGDATDFAREDYVEAAWRIVDPVLGNVTPLTEYDPGTWGPREAGPGLAPPGGWRDPGPEAGGRPRGGERLPGAGEQPLPAHKRQPS